MAGKLSGKGRTSRKKRSAKTRSKAKKALPDPYWIGVAAQPGKLTDFNDQWWSLARAEFESMAEDIRHVSIQTLDQAVKGQWFQDRKEYDKATGGLKLGIPYKRHLDTDFTKSILNETAGLVRSLARLFASHKLTPRFVSELARFNYVYGYVVSLTMNFGDEAKGERGRRKGTEASKREDAKRWVACLIVRLLDEEVQRKVAEARVFIAIKELIARKDFPAGYTEAWFTRLLSKGGLVSTVTQKYLSNKAARRMAALTGVKIPPLDIAIPKA